MKLTTFSGRLLSAAALSSLLLACSRNIDPQPATGLYNDGAFVINEGNFFDNNGTISWIPRAGSTAQNNLFQLRNNRPLTGGVSGYVEANNRGIILIDNSSAGSDKVEIISADSLRSLKTLASPDIENPRDAARVSNTKVYVTCWGSTGTYPNTYINPGYIAVIDLTTNTITKRISMQKGAESVTVVGNEAYVTGVGGERLIQVVDTQTDAVKTSIPVTGSISPLVVDANGKLWGTMGKNVVRLDPTSKTIEATIAIGSSSSPSPSGLTPSADGRSMYYKYTSYDTNYNGVSQLYRFAITDATITPTTPVISRSFTGFTALGIDAKTNAVYVGVTPSYKQAGYVYRYQSTGQLIDSVRVDIAPTGFYFK